MDKLLNFMTQDTMMHGYAVHNWIIALIIVVTIWVTIIVRDV